MTDEFETQLTAYLIAQFAAKRSFAVDDLFVTYHPDDERTTINIVQSDPSCVLHYDCTAGSDDDGFVFIQRHPPIAGRPDVVEIDFPPFFND